MSIDILDPDVVAALSSALGGGGSTAGAVKVRQFVFTETDGPGDYEASFVLPVRSTVIAIWAKTNSAGWTGLDNYIYVEASTGKSPLVNGWTMTAGDQGWMNQDMEGSPLMEDDFTSYPAGTTISVRLEGDGTGPATGVSYLQIMYVEEIPTENAVKS